MIQEFYTMNSKLSLALTIIVMVLFMHYFFNSNNRSQRSSLLDDDSHSSRITAIVNVRIIYTRAQLGPLMDAIGGTRMIEIGVNRGQFAENMFKHWKSLEKYYGIDPWQKQDSTYMSALNLSNRDHQLAFENATERLAPYKDRVELIKGFSLNEAYRFENESVDLIYIDGRHDYCGFYQDMEAYWPKLKKGGIMVNHDYVDPQKHGKMVDWTLCANGTRITGGIVKAVKDFMELHYLRKLHIIRETDSLASCYFQKPFENQKPVFNKDESIPE